MERPSWDEYFIDIAFEVAKRSTCPRLQVGAILVRDRRILTTGYNGSPAGTKHCTEVGCKMVGDHCIRTVHAEQNTVIQAALHGVSTQGSTLYTTHEPCQICTKILINAGVVRIVFANNYPNEFARQLLAEAGVALVKFEKGEG